MVEGNKETGRRIESGKKAQRVPKEKQFQSNQAMDQRHLADVIARLAHFENLRKIALSHGESDTVRDLTYDITQLEKQKESLEKRVNRP